MSPAIQPTLNVAKATRPQNPRPGSFPWSNHLPLPTFIKQYGIERTGTNALRALLEGYVGGVVVLMHVLGDKHSPPVDLRAMLSAVRGRPDAAAAFVTAATLAAPAATTDVPGNARQVEHLRRIASDLYRAALAGDIRVAVSIRDPYEWARSMLVHHRSAVVSSLCDRFNNCYAAWLPRADAVVRYEELRGDLDPLAARLVRALGLPGPVRAGARLPQLVGVTRWDDDPTVEVGVDFEHARRSRHGRTPLPDRLVEVVTERIDWRLLAPYDYAPMSF
jgi:hypothetical protein